MKYVKTEDGCITEGNFELGKIILTVWGEEIITKENSADTIEELCDVAVIVGKRYDEPYHWWFYRHKDSKKNDLVEIVKDYMEIWGNEDYMVFENVYGAIWTEKGLIYVAKMNDKGELELL